MSLLDSFLLDPHAFHVWIAYRTDGNKGSGTVNDPYNGSTQAAFDAAMAGLPDDQPLHIHLGPSPRDESGTPIPFRTGGCWVKRNPDNIGQSLFGCAWLPKPNMAIVGSGIDVTVLKLADVPSNGTEQRHYFAIGAPTTSPTDFLEISDLTIDCNQPSNADVACGAIRVMGHHVRIRRVKCINWGNRANQGNHPGNVICLIVVDPDPGSPVLAADDAGIEDCIAVGGSTSNVLYEIGIFHVGGAGYGFGAITQFGRAPFIRNCLIDGGTTDPYLNVHGCSMDGCHGGVIEGNVVSNAMCGGPFHRRLNTRELIIRNNVFRNVYYGVWFDLWYPIAAFYGNFMGVQKLLVDGNLMELLPNPMLNIISCGVNVGDLEAVTPPHGQIIIRNNRIRFLRGRSGSSQTQAINIRGATAANISDNLVETIPAAGAAVETARCTTATLFHNRSPDGVLHEVSTDRFAAQLSGPGEDTVAAACFAK